MEPSITETLFALPEQGFPITLSNDIKRFAQQDHFFHLATQKHTRSKKLNEHFAGKAPKKIYIGGDLHGFSYQHPGVEVVQMDKEFFNDTDPALRAAKRAQLEGCMVIVNNNDVGRGGGAPNYGDFYVQCDKTIFAVWDWDNHHWLDNSTFAAAHSDLYVPAHHENLYLLTRYNWCTAGPVYCATIQWPRAFLASQVANMVTAERSNEPLGKHIGSAPFSFRNRVVSTLSQRYPSIGFSTHSFHGRTLEDRLNEWIAHKVHWIIPVLNDVPIRIFDALISGGIPIVPESLRYLPPVNQISRDHILFYTPEDIINPERIVNQALKMFDEGGTDQLVERHRYALDHHHASGSIGQIVRFLNEKFGTTA
jgi:hypothetical protein